MTLPRRPAAFRLDRPAVCIACDVWHSGRGTTTTHEKQGRPNVRAAQTSRGGRTGHTAPARAKRPAGRKAPSPGFVQPCLATLRASVPDGEDWIHEIKFDGYRIQAHLVARKPVLYTRRGRDWTATLDSIARALVDLDAADAVLDGETVVLDTRGVSDYHALQGDLARHRSDRLVYYAFDLLYLDGYDLRDLPLHRRKAELARLLDGAPARLRLSEHLDAEGHAVFEQACALHLEGVVSKLRDSLYRSGRRKSWLKVKCGTSASFPIVAFVEKLGAHPRRIASLYLGRREGDRLLYAGKARSGYTETAKRMLRERLDPLIRASSPLSVPVEKPKATWVEPVLEAEVRFSTMTNDGLLREAVFEGLREDRGSRDESLSAGRADRSASATPRRRRPATRSSAGVPKENILQLLPDAIVPSKEALETYWRTVADVALVHLANRPLKLVRHVHGTTFYHMGPLPPIPKAVRRLEIEKREGGRGTRLWIEDVAGLLGLVEIGAVELHPWNATVDDVERPDRLVFDLDPGEGLEWAYVVETALAMRNVLRAESLEPWPKLTGGKGVHLMVPIERGMSHDDARRYCRGVARRVARRDTRFTLSPSARRAGRLFIDYLRNGRGTTAVGAYSPRARPGLPIAAPVAWEDLERGIRPDAYTMTRPPPRPRPSR